ncbi:SIR2 family protein [Methylobacterium frigidaeris]|nr:SIR2 family protein [Methylobacterium frigidaeris]
MIIEAGDQAYLIRSLKAGEAMLVLGAGASFTSENSQGKKIKIGDNLAKTFADRAGIDYAGENLVEVLGAVRGTILSDPIIHSILSAEYKGCAPSPELEDLFKFTWKRIYTWNIDDTLENAKGRSVQSKRYYNGLRDKAVQFEGLNILHIVHLHGEAAKPEHGFILTEQEYAEYIKSEKHFWYQKLAQDYLSSCPIFIGSRLAEPILTTEIERAKRDGKIVGGKSFLITPDKLSVIQTANLKAKGIVHIQSTLEDFVKWLKIQIPGGWSPKDVVSLSNNLHSNYLDGISYDEIPALHNVKPILVRQIRDNFVHLTKTDQDRRARNFLEGFQPSWIVALSSIPVWLDNTEQLYKSFDVAVKNNNKFFIVTGQAGSGKTTAVMSMIAKYSENNNLDIYELKPDVKNVSKVFSVLRRISHRKAIVYIGDLFVYGDNFRNYLDSVSGEQVIVVSTARSGEWGEHFVRYLGDLVIPFQFQRFIRKDYEPLIERLVKYGNYSGVRSVAA